VRLLGGKEGREGRSDGGADAMVQDTWSNHPLNNLVLWKLRAREKENGLCSAKAEFEVVAKDVM
jgi:hypothetical protein